MERFSGGGEMEMSGEEDNLVQSVVDDLRKNGEKRETSSDNRGGERGGGGGEKGVVTGERGRTIPLPDRRSLCLPRPRGTFRGRSEVTSSRAGKFESCEK